MKSRLIMCFVGSCDSGENAKQHASLCYSGAGSNTILETLKYQNNF